ncbi:hypothetical protein [Actinomadura macrotermitis]|uniref:Uncharacterized protein n=1 Tax=Actinomadura macrotermitis TaxID=2585200 RepID=A0A7K0C171_9ACTN|nr:hypothetical protein [Actinomadura macrotermitis]MQY07215.1 hypothetical protein [Actinomadura macrotermitis]
MSNTVRHVLGLLLGLVATPLVAAGLAYGSYRWWWRMRYQVGVLRHDDSGGLAGLVVLLVVAVLLGLLMGSRVSPLASLVPGVLFGGLGLLWLLAPRWAMLHSGHGLSSNISFGYTTLATNGALIVIGGALLVASLPPSRWKAKAPRQGAVPPPYQGAPMPGPGRPAPMPQDAPPLPQPRPAAPQAPAQPPAPQPSAPRHDGEGGEWTQMFGGKG